MKTFAGGGLSPLAPFLRRALFLLAVIFLGTLPVPAVQILRQDGKLWVDRKVLPGQEIVTVYTHSVEQTEVRDVIRVSGGALWTWETWTKSQNAGLPTDTGLWGRYFFRDQWQIYQGMRTSSRRVLWRVGDAFFGKNIVEIPPDFEEKVFLSFPGQRLLCTVSWRPGLF